jgi:hypothetical protein
MKMLDRYKKLEQGMAGSAQPLCWIMAGTTIISFSAGFGANEAASTVLSRERLSWENAGIFRETVGAGITKESYEAFGRSRLHRDVLQSEAQAHEQRHAVAR